MSLSNTSISTAWPMMVVAESSVPSGVTSIVTTAVYGSPFDVAVYVNVSVPLKPAAGT
jgi:hypothetical protein